MLFGGGGQRFGIMLVVAIGTGLFPPLIRLCMLTPQVAFQDSLEGTNHRGRSMLYMVAVTCPPKKDTKCRSTLEDFHKQVFRSQPHLLAKSFQAARLLGATRANHVAGTVSTARNDDPEEYEGTLIAVSSTDEAEKTLSNIQKTMKQARMDTRAELVFVPTGSKPVVSSKGYIPGDFGQWLLGYRLQYSLIAAIVEHGFRQDDAEAYLKVVYSNVSPRHSSLEVDVGHFCFFSASKKNEKEEEEEEDDSHQQEGDAAAEEEDEENTVQEKQEESSSSAAPAAEEEGASSTTTEGDTKETTPKKEESSAGSDEL